MAKIIAKGIFRGVECEVEVVSELGSIVIMVNGEHDDNVQAIFDKLLKISPALGGTYYPPENSMLSAYSVLVHTFFDSVNMSDISIIGDIGTIPTYDIGVLCIRRTSAGNSRIPKGKVFQYKPSLIFNIKTGR